MHAHTVLPAIKLKSLMEVSWAWDFRETQWKEIILVIFIFCLEQ